jgi:predicted Rossmann fold flavoprotein
MSSYKLIIIGGGSSGLMTVVCAIKYGGISGGEILIIEKNSEMGKKLKISGGGRCNIYNAEYDTQLLLNNYGENKKYLHSIFEKFNATHSRQFFQELGLETKVEDRKRAFPVTDSALDVFNSMYKFILENKVNIILNTNVKSFELNSEGKVESVKVKVNNKEEIFIAKKYVLATGGYSHPETGSTGDGFRALEELDMEVKYPCSIKINKPNPSLVPLVSPDKWIHNLSGKVIENIKITIKVDGLKRKVIKHTENIETKNRILFTHFGLSGPTILNNSKYINSCLSEGEVTIHLDLFPTLDERELDTFLLRVLDENKNKQIKNILNQIYGGNVLESILGQFIPELDLTKQVNDIRVSERKQLIELLKNIKINISGLSGYDKAIIADGGVDCSQVNFEDMTLRKIPNLAVTGDMLDISRPSGGYSLQLCWTTGYVAGICAPTRD